jgi:hypothetical protein
MLIIFCKRQGLVQPSLFLEVTRWIKNAVCPFKESTRSTKKWQEHCRLLYISSLPKVSRGKQNSRGLIDIVCPCLSAVDITLFKIFQISFKTTIWIIISSTRKIIKLPNPACSKSRTECWETCERLWNRCTNVGRGCFKHLSGSNFFFLIGSRNFEHNSYMKDAGWSSEMQTAHHIFNLHVKIYGARHYMICNFLLLLPSS